MAAPAHSFLSEIADFARDQLNAALFGAAAAYRVIVDSPSGVQKLQAAGGETKGALNLFFYRFEPSGFFPQAASDERWHIRARCLVTAFSIEDSGVAPGEIDLRVLGAVMQHFQEHPVMMDAARGLHLEVVPGNLSSEEINQIWMSQHDVPYRPSLLYEFALLPVEPKKPALPPSIVVAGGSQARISATKGGVFKSPDATPMSPFMQVADGADWSPLISFVNASSSAVQTLTAPVNAPPQLRLWIAGDVAETVNVVWESLSGGDWTQIDPPASWPAKAIPAQPPGLAGVINPKAAHLAATVAIDPPTTAGTYLLVVRRASGQRSNPLMLHLRAPSP